MACRRCRGKCRRTFSAGGKEAAYISLRAYSFEDGAFHRRPAGEFWLVHQSGTTLNLQMTATC